MKASLLILAMLPMTAIAQSDLSSMPNQELCVLTGMSLISAQSTYPVTLEELAAETTKRGEKCDSEHYMTAAVERVRRLDAIDASAQQDSMRLAQEQEQRSKDRRDRLRQALQNISNNLQQQQQQYQQQQFRSQSPQTTHCTPDYAGGMRCTTY